MDQLVERLLPIPEVRGSNFFYLFVYCQLCIEKTKIKKKKPGMAHFLTQGRKVALKISAFT